MPDARGVTVTPSPSSTAETDSERKLDQLEDQLGQLLDTIRQRLRARAATVDPVLAPAGYRVLMALAHLGPTNPTELSDSLGFDKSVLSRQLHQLRDLGLIKRDPDPADRRGAVISLTPAARDRMEVANARERDLFRSRLGSWRREDLDDLIRLLAKLRED